MVLDVSAPNFGIDSNTTYYSSSGTKDPQFYNQVKIYDERSAWRNRMAAFEEQLGLLRSKVRVKLTSWQENRKRAANF